MSKIIIFLISCIAVLSPTLPLVVVTGVMIFFDFFTGVWKSLKRGDIFSSTKMSNSGSKMFLYQLAILTGFLLEVYILNGIIPVSKIVAGFLATTEFQSLIENIGEITGIDIWGNIKKYFVKRSENADLNKEKEEEI